ncbi:hypothetical protein ADL03_06765 [Nocardia sp. NRRL S-836]|nr:hypothetical protein ADL03_06765 [Nocardia sp. NRRL S-836]
MLLNGYVTQRWCFAAIAVRSRRKNASSISTVTSTSTHLSATTHCGDWAMSAVHYYSGVPRAMIV